MALRNIVIIDEEKCNGCGDCVTSCAEGAIAIIDGKAKLVSETYCDGLGACLGSCPMDAITVEERDCAEFDEAAVEEHLAKKSKTEDKKAAKPFQCPGSLAMSFDKPKADADAADGDVASQLAQWPVQLHLVSPQAPYFKNADLLLAADCVAFAMGDFHSKMLKGKAVAIACPKLDDVSPYVQKLADIIRLNDIKSLTVAHMMVPCCTGLVRIAEEAIKLSGVSVDFVDITVDLQGQLTLSEV